MIYVYIVVYLSMLVICEEHYFFSALIIEDPKFVALVVESKQ